MRRVLLGLLLSTVVCGAPLFAGARNPAPAALTEAIASLDHEASVSAESPMVVAYLIEKEYGTKEEELKWAVDHQLKWGQITALAYIQATTGKTFAEMTHNNAPR